MFSCRCKLINTVYQISINLFAGFCTVPVRMLKIRAAILVPFYNPRFNDVN